MPCSGSSCNAALFPNLERSGWSRLPKASRAAALMRTHHHPALRLAVSVVVPLGQPPDAVSWSQYLRHLPANWVRFLLRQPLQPLCQLLTAESCAMHQRRKCRSIYLSCSVLLSMYLSSCPSICPSICPSFKLSTYLSAYPSLMFQLYNIPNEASLRDFLNV